MIREESRVFKMFKIIFKAIFAKRGIYSPFRLCETILNSSVVVKCRSMKMRHLAPHVILRSCSFIPFFKVMVFYQDFGVQREFDSGR